MLLLSNLINELIEKNILKETPIEFSQVSDYLDDFNGNEKTTWGFDKNGRRVLQIADLNYTDEEGFSTNGTIRIFERYTDDNIIVSTCDIDTKCIGLSSSTVQMEQMESVREFLLGKAEAIKAENGYNIEGVEYPRYIHKKKNLVCKKCGKSASMLYIDLCNDCC